MPIYHGRADSHQREEPGGGFAMQPDAAVRVRIGMNKSFVESIGGLELTPVSHRITRIGLALTRRLVLFLLIDGKIARRSRSTRFAHVALGPHQKAIAFHDVNVLRGEGEFDYHLGGIVRLYAVT